MKSNTETIVDDNGFELIVEYQYEEDKEHYEDKGNIGTFVPYSVYTEIKKVELVFAGRGAVIPHDLLTVKQIVFIISKLIHSND